VPSLYIKSTASMGRMLSVAYLWCWRHWCVYASFSTATATVGGSSETGVFQEAGMRFILPLGHLDAITTVGRGWSNL
jgi:hypothetical protein